MEKRFCVITILDSLSETSMPWNEFILYRNTHHNDIKEIVIVCMDSAHKTIIIPDNVQVVFVGHNDKKLLQAFREAVKECSSYSLPYMVHLHQLKSTLSFYKACQSVRKLWAGKTMFTVHSVYSLRDRKYKLSSLLCAMFSHEVVCCSEASYKGYSSLVKKLKGKYVYPIQNGVDVERIVNILQNRTQKAYTNELINLICVGRLIPIKNQKFLINLMPELSECRLILVGADDQNETMKKYAEQSCASDRIEFTGIIPRNEVFSKLSSAEIYVSASHVEGMPVSVLEAMTAGLPVILSDIEPHKEIAAKKQDVVVILPLESNAWIAIIKKFIKEKKYLEMGKRCRDLVIREFSLARMHEKYIEKYADLAGIKTRNGNA
jgi:glycosyltransferase involved in cell wall biosynthesis